MLIRMIRGFRFVSAVMSVTAVLTMENTSFLGLFISLALLAGYIGFTVLEENVEEFDEE